MQGKTQYASKQTLDWLVGQAPYLGFFTANPTDVGGGAEVTTAIWTTYARVEAEFAAAGDGPDGQGSIANAAEVAFGTVISASALPLTGYGLWDAPASGHLWIWGECGQTPQAFAADATTDQFTVPAHGYADSTPVFLALGSEAVPAPLVAGTVYYVRDAAADTFKLAATAGGAALNLTAAGSGFLRECYVVRNFNSVKLPVGALTGLED